MKRRILRFMACAAAMALTLSVTACGGGSDDTADVNATSETETETEAAVDAEVEAETDAEAEAVEGAVEEVKTEAGDNEAAAGDTLEDYFSDPSIKEAFEGALDAMAGEGMAIDYEVKENEFIMEFTFDDATELPENAGEMLTTELENQADTFEEQVTSFDDAIGQPGACTVTVRYFDPEGTLLAERSYTAQ